MELYTWDYCMVFKIGSEDIMLTSATEGWTLTQRVRFLNTTNDTVHRLQAAGLKTCVYKATTGTEIYCLIGASESRLRMEAGNDNPNQLMT
jgi:hypothetical protein